jgi:hypothetical protein
MSWIDNAKAPHIRPKQSVKTHARFVQLPKRVAEDVRIRRSSVARRWSGERVGLEDQTAFSSPIHHPQQRNPGQCGILVAAANIAVNPGEPHLLKSLMVRVRRLSPDRRLERGPLLIDRQRLKRRVDTPAQLRVVKLPSTVEEIDQS